MCLKPEALCRDALRSFLMLYLDSISMPGKRSSAEEHSCVAAETVPMESHLDTNSLECTTCRCFGLTKRGGQDSRGETQQVTHEG